MGPLCGFADAPMLNKETASRGYWVNTIGGQAVWPTDAVAPAATCTCCSRPMSQILQIYCPLSDSSYHRALYIFGCTLPGCNEVGSFKVFRAQVLDNEWECSHQAKCTNSEAQISSKTGDGSFNRYSGLKCIDHKSSAAKAQVLCRGPNSDTVNPAGAGGSAAVVDWSSIAAAVPGADDWGDELDLETARVVPECKITAVNKSEMPTADVWAVGVEVDGTEKVVKDKKADKDDAWAVDDGVDEADNVIRDKQKDKSHRMAETNSTKIATTQVVVAGEASKTATKKAAAESRIIGTAHLAQPVLNRDALIIIQPKYLNVSFEPDAEHVPSTSSGYEARMLADYLKQGGVIGTSSEGETSSGKLSMGEEQYEESVANHGDIVFERFTKRIARAPGQCLRYERGGQPLAVTDRTPLLPAGGPVSCSRCGAKRVFEVQLLPTLLANLRLLNDPDSVEPFSFSSEFCLIRVSTGFSGLCDVLALGPNENTGAKTLTLTLISCYIAVLIYTCAANCWYDMASSDSTPIEEFLQVQQDPDELKWIHAQAQISPSR